MSHVDNVEKKPSSMFEAAKIIGALEYNLNETLEEIGVFSYIFMKFEFHAVTWDAGSQETNFEIQDSDVPKNLYNQSRDIFEYYWRKWYKVLTNSKAPDAQQFLQKMRIAFKECSVEDVSKRVALLMCYLNAEMINSVGVKKYEVLTDVDELIKFLEELNVKDQDLLTVIRILEETTVTFDP